MGMYDHINFKTSCPTCGAEISDFQSKDGPCAMDTLEITEVDNFYCSCDQCHTWVEYTRKEGKKDSNQTLLEAKQILASIMVDVNCGHREVLPDIEEAIIKFMEKHPLPQNSIDDFEMKFETREERTKKFQDFEKDFYEKHGKNWYEFIPRAKPNVIIDPDSIEDIEIDDDDKDQT